MEFEIDKEIDALLRQAARGGTTVTGTDFNSHPAADEISMFAENALPEKAKPKFIKHLADCERCRTILANTIELNSEAEEKAASVAVGAPGKEVSAIPELPWYRKIFETPNLAYGLGALALIFAGMIGFIAVQNALQSGTSEMAKASRDSAADSNVSADRISEPSASQDLANANTSGDDLESEEPEAKSPESPAETRLKTESEREPANGPNADNSRDLQKDAPEGGKRGQDRKDQADDDADVARKNKPSGGQAKEKKLRIAKRNVELADKKADLNQVNESRPAPAPPPKPAATPAPKEKPKTSKPVALGRTITTEAAKKRREERQADSISAAEDSKGAEAYATRSRKVGGKRFALKNGVWYDSAYRSQKTTNVKRGTTRYKNLDSGLRAIGDKFKGTVVVVWKRKAYKIQ